jgi:hypothetical protein
MNEAEWLACGDSGPMLAFLRGRASERKFRLFACACARRPWHLLTDERSRRAVEEAERLADGLAGPSGVQAARAAAAELWVGAGRPARLALDAAAEAAFAALHDVASEAAGQAANGAEWAAGARSNPTATMPARVAERKVQANLLRDIFGPAPFRPLPRLNPAWLAWEGGTVPKLAASLYDERAFDRLPILADALEEAGCDAAEVLTHWRGPGPHARGCWALDLVLGKQ